MELRRDPWIVRPAWMALILGAGAGLAGAGAAAGEAAFDGAFDAAPFGFPTVEEKGRAHGIRWAEPRKVRRVVVEFAGEGGVPSPEGVRLQYWRGTWDGRPDPVLAETGAGGLGWAAMDDWTNGAFQDADARLAVEGRRWTFFFAPTGEKEFKDLGHPGVAYRKSLKVRLLFPGPRPRPKGIQAITDSVRRTIEARIQFGRPADPSIPIGPGADRIRLQAWNGAILSARAASGALTPAGEGAWELPAGAEGTLEAAVLMAVDPADPRYDRTIVTARSGSRPFSFAAGEVARGERILVDDLGVLVTRGDDPVTIEGLRRARQEFAGRTVYRRVFDEPEQTLSRAWGDMPLKRPLYFVHGLPGNRNAMHQLPNGEIEVTGRKHWFNRPRSPRDSDRKLWPGEILAIDLGLPPGSLRGGRELLEGYLPLLRTWWQDGPLHYEERTILDTLDGSLADIRGDDPTVLLVSVRVTNTSGSEKGAATLLLRSRVEGGERLSVEGDRALGGKEGEPRLRFLFRPGAGGTLAPEGDGVRWRLELSPGESREVFLAIPAVTLTREEEVEALRRRDFAADSLRIAGFWREVTARGARIETPEPWIDGFYRSHLRHLLVNCVREVGSDRLHAHVGTFGYGVYPDESAMMVSDLDRRGFHREAERCLDSFLEYQGTVPMPGAFKSKEGLFYGSGGHEMGGYNKSHGWVMWLMAEHWRFTRDRAWMERAAPKLVAACEWVIRERRAGVEDDGGASLPIEHGFLPPGSLEDVTDWWHWLVTDVTTVWGFEALAGALAEAGHPQGTRLVAEARAFRDDVLAGIEESRVLAPVVRCRDGAYRPKFPSRLHERGRSHGWLRETLEGSIHLLITGLLPPRSAEARWILEDYEDNLYISSEYGYAIPAFDRFWFSRGGFSMQANLLGGPIPYLRRDEIKHFLRAYFNSFSSGFYPEVRMLNEHSLPELGFPAGDHFKSSDEAQSTCWLRLMFVDERDGDLFLGQAIPRAWLEDGKGAAIERAPSSFGPLSLRFASHAAKGEIAASLDPPARNRPGRIYLRIRHPEEKPLRSVTVNGKEHRDFDPEKEWIVLPGTVEGIQEVLARY